MSKAKSWLTTDPRGRVLFIEDDLDTREMVSLLLSRAGYEAVSASTVTEGLRLAKVESFDLIVLDWYLPDGSGVELCQMIRTFNKEIPIFFYTGVAYESEIKKALKAGAQGCFIKPVDVNNFVQTVSRYSGGKDGLGNKSDRE